MDLFNDAIGVGIGDRNFGHVVLSRILQIRYLKRWTQANLPSLIERAGLLQAIRCRTTSPPTRRAKMVKASTSSENVSTTRVVTLSNILRFLGRRPYCPLQRCASKQKGKGGGVSWQTVARARPRQWVIVAIAAALGMTILGACASLGLSEVSLAEVSCGETSEIGSQTSSCWIAEDDRSPDNPAVMRALKRWGSEHGASDVAIDLGTCAGKFDTFPSDDVACEVEIVDGPSGAIVGRVNVSFSPGNSVKYSYWVTIPSS